MSARDIGQEVLDGIQEIKAYKAAAGDPHPTAGQGLVVERQVQPRWHMCGQRRSSSIRLRQFPDGDGIPPVGRLR